jgi:hypothetical protein
VRSEPFILKESDDFPLGGRLRFFVDFWRRIAPRKEIVSMIMGVAIPFSEEPYQLRVPPPCAFNREEAAQVRTMVADLLKEQIIEPVTPADNQFVSQLFLVTNKDLSKRAILNVRKINKCYIPKQISKWRLCS